MTYQHPMYEESERLASFRGLESSLPYLAETLARNGVFCCAYLPGTDPGLRCIFCRAEWYTRERGSAEIIAARRTHGPLDRRCGLLAREGVNPDQPIQNQEDANANEEQVDAQVLNQTENQIEHRQDENQVENQVETENQIENQDGNQAENQVANQDEENNEACGESCVYRNRLLCIVCYAKEKELFYLPCRHVVCCQECHDKLPPPNEHNKSKNCPACRTKIETEYRIFLYS